MSQQRQAVRVNLRGKLTLARVRYVNNIARVALYIIIVDYLNFYDDFYYIKVIRNPISVLTR